MAKTNTHVTTKNRSLGTQERRQTEGQRKLLKHWKMTEKDAVIIPCSSKEFNPPTAMQPPGRELYVHKKGGREGG